MGTINYRIMSKAEKKLPEAEEELDEADLALKEKLGLLVTRLADRDSA